MLSYMAERGNAAVRSPIIIPHSRGFVHGPPGRVKGRERMKTVLVTAAGSFSAAAVLGALKENGYRTAAADMNPPEVIAASADADVFCNLPHCGDREAYISALKEIIRREGIDAVIPLTDAELDVLNERRGELMPAALWAAPEETVRLARDKIKGAAAAEEAFRTAGLTDRVKTIPSELLSVLLGGALPASPAMALPELAEKAFTVLKRKLPIILKPVDGRSSEGLYRVRTEAELRTALGAIFGEELRTAPGEIFGKELRTAPGAILGAGTGAGAARYLVQPLIEGNVIAADVLRDAEGNTAAVLREELRRTSNGAGLAVRVFRDEVLERACAAAAERFSVLGAVCLEFIRDPEGVWHFLECNPRFSGGAGFSKAAGYDACANHFRVMEGGTIGEWKGSGEVWAVKKYVEVITKRW